MFNESILSFYRILTEKHHIYANMENKYN